MIADVTKPRKRVAAESFDTAWDCNLRGYGLESRVHGTSFDTMLPDVPDARSSLRDACFSLMRHR